MKTNSSKKRKRKKRRVKEPLTDELLKELLDAPNPQAFIANHDLKPRTLSGYLQQMLDEHGLKRSQVIKAADINETFGYQIFMGERGAGRDKTLQLAFAMKLTLKETNRLLQASKNNELNCKNKRDAIIIFCLTHDATLQEANEELYRFGEETIG